MLTFTAPVLALLRRHWTVAAALCLGLVFGTRLHGCGQHPMEVSTKDKVVQSAKSTEQTKATTDDHKDAQKDVAKDVITTSTTTKFPDGRVVTEKKTEDKTKVESKSVETKVQIVTQIKEVQTLKIETHEKIIKYQPKWSFGLDLALSAPGLMGKPNTSYLPSLSLPSWIQRSAVLGVSVEHRVSDHLWLGVFANTQATFGLRGRWAF